MTHLSEMLSFHIKIQHFGVIDQNRERSFRQGNIGLSQDLIEYATVCV